MGESAFTDDERYRIKVIAGFLVFVVLVLGIGVTIVALTSDGVSGVCRERRECLEPYFDALPNREQVRELRDMLIATLLRLNVTLPLPREP